MRICIVAIAIAIAVTVATAVLAIRTILIDVIILDLQSLPVTTVGNIVGVFHPRHVVHRGNLVLSNINNIDRPHQSK